MKKTLIHSIVWLAIALVVVLFARALARDWDSVQDTILSMSWTSWWSVVFFVGAVVMSGVLWGVLVRHMSGREVPVADSVRIHAASWLLKYVPGQVGSLVNKIAWAKKHGHSKKTIATSVIYENILMVFASVLLSLPLLLMFDVEIFNNSTILVALVAVVPMLVVANERVFYAILNKLLRLAKRQPLEGSTLLSSRQILGNTIYYMAPRVINGIGFVIIAAAMLPVTPDMYVPLASIFILASVIGMLALFVPSGIGVREGIIVLLASVYFAPEQAIVLALVARFFTTIADIGVALVYIILNKGRLIQK